MISSSLLEGTGRVRHAFFTRRGGVSRGPYASLNCGFGSNDDAACVRSNRDRAMVRLGLAADALVTGYQVHSADVHVVDGASTTAERPRVDGLVTRTPRVALGILTADCLPVLLADPDAGVVGAAHAGWRGALAGVVEATVAAMLGLGARAGRIVAALGPCIRQASYEVGPEFRETFVTAAPATADLFVPSPRSGHHLFDLPSYVSRRLAAIPVAAVDDLPHDTAADADRFFSYRRTTLAGGGDYGRLLSAIALTD